MTVHLIKLAVGIASVTELEERQRLRYEAAGGQSGSLRHLTRSMPRRADEILDGGSIYWVIRRAVRVRQLIVGIEAVTDDEGRRRCALCLDPRLVPVTACPRRPFQGWRYLLPVDAPLDASGDDTGELPDEMRRELHRLGLL